MNIVKLKLKINKLKVGMLLILPRELLDAGVLCGLETMFE